MADQHLTIHVDRGDAERPRGWSWMVTVVVVGIVILLVYILYSSVSRRLRRGQRARHIREAVHRDRGSESILVLLHSYRDAAEAAKTVFDVFERAASPLRVTVAVRQESRSGDADMWVLYGRVAGRHSAGSFQDRIRVVNARAEHSPGPLAGVLDLYKQVDRGEKFVLIVTPGVTVCDGWDLELLDFHSDASRQTGRPEHTLLSQVPEPVEAPVANVPPGSGGVSGVLSGMLSMARATTQGRRAPVTSRATYTRLDATYRVPSVVSAAFPHPQQRPRRITSVSGGFVFCPGALLRALAPGPEVPQYAADVVLSSMLHAAGGVFFAPPATLSWQTPSRAARSFRPAAWRKSKRPATMRLDPGYAQFVGATLRQVSGRARLGLLPDESDGVIKYGSLEELDRAKRPFI